ncbi:MAG: hypothetical protein EXS67_03925 [Candidatus Margulisbacteria bacterium]|nr:hypothetical protein [Candidatus Margulisiibacteriota bacterium]
MALRRSIFGSIGSLFFIGSLLNGEAKSFLNKDVLQVDKIGIFYKIGKVGIGTSSPDAPFHVLVTTQMNALLMMKPVTANSTTIQWSSSNYQVVSVGGSTLNVTFVNPSSPRHLMLVVKHAGTGATTFPSTIKWQKAIKPTLTSKNVDLIGFYYNGSTYYGVGNFNFK